LLIYLLNLTMRLKFFTFLCMLSVQLNAQPYFELLNLNFAKQALSSFYKGGEQAKISNNWYLANINIPLKINSKNILILTLGWEQRKFSTVQAEEKLGYSSLKQSGFISGKDVTYETFYLPLSFQHVFRDSSKSLSGAMIYRYNKLRELKAGTSNDQFGGALIFGKKSSDRFTWKAGAYYNREFFGNYFIPLAGFEWNASARLNLWGLLPRNMVIDYAINKSVHGGFSYKGITESYRNNNVHGYFSITEGQLKLFCDIYLGKSPWVISLEAGQTGGREYEFFSGENQEKINKINPSEGSILRAGITYRVVTNKKFMTLLTPAN
jgi:hypothetical protein